LKPKPKLRYTFKTEPYPYQKRALAKIHKLKGRAGLWMEMGTGKTKIAIDWAGIAHANFGLERVLVVCPISVLRVWEEQIDRHSPFEAHTIVLEGSTDEKRLALRRFAIYTDDKPGIKWVMVNYESIWRQGLNQPLKDWKPDLVICDESHRIKSPTARQSKAASGLGREAKMRLALTGTPITKSPLDIYGQFRFIDPQILNYSWTGFKHHFAIWGGFGRFQIMGYKNLPVLIGHVRANTFRIKKEQAIDLPDKVFLDVPVTLSPKGFELYIKMREQMIIEIEESHATAAIVLVKLLRLSQITSGFVKDIEGQIRIFDDSKLKACLDLLEDMLAEDQKVVIFARFRTDLERLSTSIFTKFGQHPVILSGSVPGKDRNTLIKKFREDPNTKIFIAQIQAGSLGIDLTAASHAIFYSLDYGYANYVQAQDRLHRLGQVNKVTYYHLVVPHTIDTLTLQILKEKGDLANAIVHDPTILRR
jgi:SNF2 family DNA or RNA helicase